MKYEEPERVRDNEWPVRWSWGESEKLETICDNGMIGEKQWYEKQRLEMIFDSETRGWVVVWYSARSQRRFVTRRGTVGGFEVACHKPETICDSGMKDGVVLEVKIKKL